MAEPLNFDYIKACVRFCAAEEKLCAVADSIPESEREAFFTRFKTMARSRTRGPQGEILDPHRGPQNEPIFWVN